MLTTFSFLYFTNAATSIKKARTPTLKTDQMNRQTSNKTMSNNSKKVSRTSKDFSIRNHQSNVQMRSRKIMTSLI